MFDFTEQFFPGRSDPKQSAHRFKTAPFRNTFFKNDPSVEPKKADKKLGISYDKSLISGLVRDHEILIENFGRTLKDGFESGDFPLLCKQLGDFKVLFQNHLLRENVKLFCYLEQLMGSDSKSLVSMREFRKDINNRSNAIIKFCKKYEQAIDIFFFQDSFKSDYQTAGRTLIHRSQMVESEIYSLYSPG